MCSVVGHHDRLTQASLAGLKQRRLRLELQLRLAGRQLRSELGRHSAVLMRGKQMQHSPHSQRAIEVAVLQHRRCRSKLHRCQSEQSLILVSAESFLAGAIGSQCFVLIRSKLVRRDLAVEGRLQAGLVLLGLVVFLLVR